MLQKAFLACNHWEMWWKKRIRQLVKRLEALFSVMVEILIGTWGSMSFVQREIFWNYALTFCLYLCFEKYNRKREPIRPSLFCAFKSTRTSPPIIYCTLFYKKLALKCDVCIYFSRLIFMWCSCSSVAPK